MEDFTHIPVDSLLLVGLQPLLEKILVVAVPTRPQPDLGRNKLTILRTRKSARFWQMMGKVSKTDLIKIGAIPSNEPSVRMFLVTCKRQPSFHFTPIGGFCETDIPSRQPSSTPYPP